MSATADQLKSAMHSQSNDLWDVVALLEALELQLDAKADDYSKRIARVAKERVCNVQHQMNRLI